VAAVVVVAEAAATSAAACHTAGFLVAARVAFPVAGWAQEPVTAVLTVAATGTVLAISTAAITAAAIGTATTGTAATIGAAKIGTVAMVVTGIIIGGIRTDDGVGGTVTGGVIPGTTSCLSAVLASRGGGAGAGALGRAVATATATVTVTTVVIPTTVAATAIPITAMATVAMAMDMVTATDTVPRCSTENTEAAANPESLSCNGGYHALAIIVARSTESWGHRRALQSGHTNRSTAT